MRAQFGNLVRQSDICVLCGVRKATTGEHIPPRSLFRQMPAQYLTVPACDICNNASKLEDEYLRQVMSATSLIGEGRMVWDEKVVPKFKDHPKTQAGLREAVTIGEVQTMQFGAFFAPQFKVSGKRIYTSIAKMVSGLYWWHTGKLFPSRMKIDIGFLDATKGQEYFDNEKNKAFFNQTVMGIYDDAEIRKTFFYTCAISKEKSLWYFFFYKQSILIAMAFRRKRSRAR